MCSSFATVYALIKYILTWFQALVEPCLFVQPAPWKLQMQFNFKSSSFFQQTNSLKSMYEKELSEARKLLDELSKDKASLQLEVASIKDKHDGVRAE